MQLCNFKHNASVEFEVLVYNTKIGSNFIFSITISSKCLLFNLVSNDKLCVHDPVIRDFKIWYSFVVVQWQMFKVTSSDIMMCVPTRLSHCSLLFCSHFNVFLTL